MKWREKRAAFLARHSERFAGYGLQLEKEVERILLAMKERGSITEFKKHPPNTIDDLNGKDFTVWKLVGETMAERSFGVTISSQRRNRSAVLHRKIPQWWLPIGTKPETITRKILELFQ